VDIEKLGKWIAWDDPEAPITAYTTPFITIIITLVLFNLNVINVDFAACIILWSFVLFSVVCVFGDYVKGKV
jgi:hypothetical protein